MYSLRVLEYSSTPTGTFFIITASLEYKTALLEYSAINCTTVQYSSTSTSTRVLEYSSTRVPYTWSNNNIRVSSESDASGSASASGSDGPQLQKAYRYSSLTTGLYYR